MPFDKLILVFYININDILFQEFEYDLEKVKNYLSSSDEENKIIKYFIPTHDSETRIECLNPPIAINDNEMYNKFIEKIENIEKKLDRVDSIMFPMTRNILLEKSHE